MSNPTTLAERLVAKIGESPVTQVAKEMGVSYLALTKVIKGQSVPNKKTQERYATYLGLSAEEMAPLLNKPAKAKPAKGAKRGRKPGTKIAKIAKKSAKATGPVDLDALVSGLESVLTVLKSPAIAQALQMDKDKLKTLLEFMGRM